MTRGEFLELLSRWKGRSHVQSQLETRGFMIPRQYQALVEAQCAADARGGLDLYWDEHAREYVCSAGRANSFTREFFGVSSYRSQYLDKLALSRKESPLFATPPLHPCLLEFATKCRADASFEPRTIEEIEAHKLPEMHALGSRFSWTGQKKEARSIFSDLMREKGFAKLRNHRRDRMPGSFVKDSTCGLIFGGVVDVGGRPFCVAVPFHFFIAGDLAMDNLFELSFNFIVPGFWHYYRFGNLESAVLGFQAHVEMIDIMSTSFSLA
jgi:hypothetical protein